MGDPAADRCTLSCRSELVALANRFGDQAVIDAACDTWPELTPRPEIERLRAALAEYRLWEPGRRGYADARRRLDEAFKEGS